MTEALIAGLIVLLLAGGFGLYSRRTSRKLGEVTIERDEAARAYEAAKEKLVRTTRPRPTLSKLRRVSERMSDDDRAG